jgi:uncharacterized protein
VTISAEIPFRGHPLVRGGHLQTILGTLRRAIPVPYRAIAHRIDLHDGDSIVLHDDCPKRWNESSPSLLLIHGLCGCHRANYMVKLAYHFAARGVRVFRMDMRGCGAAEEFAKEPPHAGRSDDVLDALAHMAAQGNGPLLAVGVSMGANQLLKGLGEITDPQHPHHGLGRRIKRTAVIAPPIDLVRCSRNIGRLGLKLYNAYFIRRLLKRLPPLVRQGPIFPKLRLRPTPKAMWDFDDRVTAPLSGFRDARDYYDSAASLPWLAKINTPTLVLAADDDPLIPVDMIREAPWSPSTTLHITRTGGHVGYFGTRRERDWLDQLLDSWLLGH